LEVSVSASAAPAPILPAPSAVELPRVGRFDCLATLGVGGMATVYLARSVGAGGIERLAALKVMHPFLGADREFVGMFLDEARVAARIRHPNVVANVDLGIDREQLFMVMDYVEGDTLAAVQTAASRLSRAIPLGVVLRIILDALAGLEAAHSLTTADDVDLKVVHRDVSPQNILVGVDGTTRLTDFGIARAEQRIATTRTGTLKGKAPFMAPEQLEGRPVDRRADVFAMGVTLWEAVALRRLYPGREGAPSRNARPPYRPLKDVLPTVPDELDAIVARALAPDASQRYPTAAAFADALEQAFRPLIASHRQVGAFMALVAADKIQRERDAVRLAPKPVDDDFDRISGEQLARTSGFGRCASERPISATAAKMFETRPPPVLRSIPPANDTRLIDDARPPIASPSTAPYLVGGSRRPSSAGIGSTTTEELSALPRPARTSPGLGQPNTTSKPLSPDVTRPGIVRRSEPTEEGAPVIRVSFGAITTWRALSADEASAVVTETIYREPLVPSRAHEVDTVARRRARWLAASTAFMVLLAVALTALR
jgi:serine/threonine protein kinase